MNKEHVRMIITEQFLAEREKQKFQIHYFLLYYYKQS